MQEWKMLYGQNCGSGNAAVSPIDSNLKIISDSSELNKNFLINMT